MVGGRLGDQRTTECGLRAGISRAPVAPDLDRTQAARQDGNFLGRRLAGILAGAGWIGDSLAPGKLVLS